MVGNISLTKGWKGYLGAAILIIAGFYLLYKGNYERAIELIGVGLGILGIRHKLSYGKK